MLTDSNTDSIFNLAIDEDIKYNFKEIAKWARFLAVVGFVSLVLIILGAIAVVVTQIAGTGSITIGLAYLFIGAIYAYPVITLFNFGKQMRYAMRNHDQVKMNGAIRNLKYCFQYLGITTIILLCVYAIVIIYFLIIQVVNL